MAQKYHIAIGIDAKGGKVAVDGWGDVSSVDAIELASRFKDSSIEAIICTDIDKDGMLCGVNIQFALDIQNASNKLAIASGGVKNIDDIKAVKTASLGGVIVGKAFYEGSLDLKEAFSLK
jgi:phosphoribosylformimino-5-aminoimidazole carboxamide ribotide isomerase